MRMVKWISLAVLAVIVVDLVVTYLSLDHIVRSTIESQGTQQLGVQTTLRRANVSLFGGSLSLKNLAIGSPKGFSAPELFSLGQADIGVKFGQLMGEPIHIQTVTIHAPALVIEQQNLKLNINALVDQMPSPPTTTGKTAGQKEPVKVIIDNLAIDNASVSIHPGQIPGVKLPDQISLNLPAINLKNIGNADGNENGAAIKEVVVQVITALAGKASESDQLPPELKSLMSLNVNSIASQLGAQFNKQLGDITGQITKNLPAEIGKNIDVNKLTTQPSQAIQQGINNLLGGGKEKKKKSE